ncbi:hypothetical protein J6O48_05705 [bacterium]|nr:hypothetical protein [bacterium]
MSNYLKKFNIHSDYETYINGSDKLLPNVSYCENENELHYNPYVHDYSKDYLTFEALEDGTFTMTLTAKLPTTCVESVSYSIDNGETWVTTNNVDNTIVTITTPTIMQGNKVIWKGTGV